MVKCNFRYRRTYTYYDSTKDSMIIEDREGYACGLRNGDVSCDEENCIFQKILKKVK